LGIKRSALTHSSLAGTTISTRSPFSTFARLTLTFSTFVCSGGEGNDKADVAANEIKNGTNIVKAE
jgi:hypothetical protein